MMHHFGMAQALIRNLDDDLLADYRRAAKQKGRSLEAELRDGLDRGRPAQRLSKDALIALSRQLRAMTPEDARDIDSTAVIRERRDEGYGQSV